MDCLRCTGCTTDTVLGTEKVKACEECGAVRPQDEYSVNLSELSSHQEPFNHTVRTPIQKLSIAKVDSLIEKLNLQNSKKKCHLLFGDVMLHPKYKKRSRMNIAAACLVITSRPGSVGIQISKISSELGCTQSEVGRLVMKIKRDFNIPSSLPNPKSIIENLLQVFFSPSINNSPSLCEIQETAEELCKFTCELLNLESRFPHIHACLYISLVHFQQNRAPSLSVFSSNAGTNKDTVQKYISMITNRIVDISAEFPIAVTKKNFFHKVSDIMKFRSVFLRYARSQRPSEDIPELILQSDPAHPIHHYTKISDRKEDESLSGVTDSEIDNIILCPSEVEQKKNFIQHNHDIDYGELFPSKTSRKRVTKA